MINFGCVHLRKSVQSSQNETVEMISSLADDLENEKREKEALLVTIESQRFQIDMLQANAVKVSDMRSAELAKVDGLQLQMRSYEKQNAKLKADCKIVLKEKEDLLEALKTEKGLRDNDKDTAIRSSGIQTVDSLKMAEQETQIANLSSELSHAVSSLQQAVNSAKAIKVKFEEEKQKCITFEKRIRELELERQELKTSKELISSTILDSLHKEQEKTTSLERILQSHIPGNDDGLQSSAVSHLCDLIDSDGSGYINSSSILHAISKKDSETLKLLQTVGLVPSGVDTAKALEFAKKIFGRFHDGANYAEFFEYLKSYKAASVSLTVTPRKVMMDELQKMRNVKYYYYVFRLDCSY